MQEKNARPSIRKWFAAVGAVAALSVCFAVGVYKWKHKTLLVELAISSSYAPQEIAINGVRVGQSTVRLDLADIPGLVELNPSDTSWRPPAEWQECDRQGFSDGDRVAEIVTFEDSSEDHSFRYFLRVRDGESMVVAPLEVTAGTPRKRWFMGGTGVGVGSGWFTTSVCLTMGVHVDL